MDESVLLEKTHLLSLMKVFSIAELVPFEPQTV